MNENPVLKPKLATPALVLVSVTTMICVVCLLIAAQANWAPVWVSMALGIAFLFATVCVGAVWLARGRRLYSWMADAREQWEYFDEAKGMNGTTAEVTVVSVDGLEPTGSWITIKWQRFDHIQAAWLEALPEPIWPGTVLLIAPDPAQVMPGVPWPTNYYIQASHCLAWAPRRLAR
ncbi:hypothetical protein [Arthrobacter globiformis]|jgi:hypothetical protein|uniref:hypothetical protein n=1 Tax=Arthrobacter globiformis TaxID=1665 RepID=UPI00278E29C9|nr:hypothetical protein [Arthrobacter globiformis]MDQ0618081.1 hypothetical protein [Arthrobacter globiformis]